MSRNLHGFVHRLTWIKHESLARARSPGRTLTPSLPVSQTLLPVSVPANPRPRLALSVPHIQYAHSSFRAQDLQNAVGLNTLLYVYSRSVLFLCLPYFLSVHHKIFSFDMIHFSQRFFYRARRGTTTERGESYPSLVSWPPWTVRSWTWPSSLAQLHSKIITHHFSTFSFCGEQPGRERTGRYAIGGRAHPLLYFTNFTESLDAVIS